MKIYLQAYAILKEHFPQEKIEYEIEEGATVADLMHKLAQDFPVLADLLPMTRLASEDEYIHAQTLLVSQMEYCLIPPVSGG